jgi:cilia- and flagella-associated protein 298
VLKAILDLIPHNEATIWFSGKEMASTKKLSDYLGKNEKSKVIVKIQKVTLKFKYYNPIFIDCILKFYFRLFYRIYQFNLKRLKIHNI